jgi:predicted nucleic acid-binding protein
MATTIPDTGFLFSLYGNDGHTATAREWVVQNQSVLSVTALGHYELQNALRFAAFRKSISQSDALASLAAVEADLRDGHLELVSCDFTTVVAAAARFSERHSLRGGHRSFDILHVATAKHLKATTFLSFDANQRRLAAAVGLAVAP